jgi:hypothetical protein
MFVSQITTVNDFIYKYMYKNTPTQTQNQQNIYYMGYMYTIIKYPHQTHPTKNVYYSTQI